MKSNFRINSSVHATYYLSNGGIAVIKKGDGRLIAYNKTMPAGKQLPKIWDWVRKDS